MSRKESADPSQATCAVETAMRRLIALIIAILALDWAQDAEAEQRLALIITNQGYPPQLGTLSKSHADGEILNQALRQDGFDVRLVKDADKPAMLGAIREYAKRLEKAGSDGVGFFYYSGHGAATEKFGDNYLIPVGVQISSQLQLTTLGLSLGEVIDTLSQTNSQVNFVIIDACRDVAFRPIPGQRGLKPEGERRGILIEFSTGPGDVAVDENIFSSALAEEISKSGREALQVFRAVRLKVLDATREAQFPWTRDGLVRDFFFAGPPAADAKADQLRLTRMLAEWEAIKDSGSAPLLEKFEQRYSSGVLSKEAQRRRLALGPPAQIARTSKRGTPITVWNVASPHPGVADPKALVPSRLERRATALGYVINLSIVPAREFAGRLFEAMGTDKQPDILSIDNYGHMTGTTTDLGKFVGIQTNTQVRQSLVVVEEVLSELARGWQYLLRGSPNHDIARALVEDLVECDAEVLDRKGPDFAKLRRANEDAVASLVECQPFDQGITDPERFPTICKQDSAPLRIKVIKTCRISGNDQLAFASSVVGIDSNERIGRRSVATVLHKTDKWRVLTVATDPVSTKQFGLDVLPFARRLAPSAIKAAPPSPAVILTPDGAYPSPKAGERFGDFVWKGSASTGVIGEIAEFNYGYDVRLFLFPGAPGGQDRLLSTGQLWTTKTPWVWRVWSINQDGHVVVSEPRQFRH
jgi:hypothetical protein